MGRRDASAGVLTMLAFAAAPAIGGAASVVDSRTIPDNITLAVPLFPCAVPVIAERIAVSVGTPAGIESIPDCAHQDPLPPRNLPPTINALIPQFGFDNGRSLNPRLRFKF